VNIAEHVVAALLDGWLSDRWDDFKAFTGIGHDSFGLGKNTEPGWTPSYGRKVKARTPEDEDRLRKERDAMLLKAKLRRLQPGDKNTWELD